MKIKSRRFYMIKGTPALGGFPGVPSERVRVTGFADVNGEQWCRIRFDGDKVSKLLCHPSRLQGTA